MTSRIEMLKAYLLDDPSDAFTIYALALEYVKLKELSLAENLFEQLLKEQDHYLPVYYQAGKLKEMLGKQDQAESIYNMGMTLALKQGDRHTYNELKAALGNDE